jgi:hypothetical protein
MLEVYPGAKCRELFSIWLCHERSNCQCLCAVTMIGVV